MNKTPRHFIIWHSEIREREFHDSERGLIRDLLNLRDAAGVSVWEFVPDEGITRDITPDAAEWAYSDCDMCAVEDPEYPEWGMGDFVTRHIDVERIRQDYAEYRANLHSRAVA